MPTNKQRREAARRHLERQLQRRQEREQARRRFTLIASIVGTLVLIVVVVVFVVAVGSDSKKHPAAAASTAVTPTPRPTPTSTFVAQKTTGPCGYTTTDPTTNPSLKNVGVPPDSRPTPSKNLTVDFQTNRGLIEATLDAKTAPCTVQSIAYLIQKKFYDNTPCPRVVNSGLFVVQCGSGGTSTAGGPTYTVPDENLSKANYAAGAIAMANTGQPHTGSSQFFFVTKDSNAGLGKSYTVFGQVTKGLNILQSVATGGNDGASSAGGGAPKLALTFKSVKVVGTS